MNWKMAESDRFRSPVPSRNRGEQRGQEHGVRPELPFFPRWVTPMQAAVWHSTQMSRPQSRLQFSPQFNGFQPGPYMMNQAMGSLCIPPISHHHRNQRLCVPVCAFHPPAIHRCNQCVCVQHLRQQPQFTVCSTCHNQNLCFLFLY